MRYSPQPPRASACSAGSPPLGSSRCRLTCHRSRRDPAGDSGHASEAPACMFPAPPDAAADHRLVEAALAGQAAASEQLIQRLLCVPRILHSMNARMGRPLGPEDLQDSSQDAIALVWSKLSEFAGRSALETWIYRFCFHVYMNSLRRRRRVGRSLQLEESQPDNAADQVLKECRDFVDLQTLLSQIDQEEAHVIWLKHVEDCTFEEIGARQSRSPNTIKTQYYRGLRHLAALLERNRAAQTEG